MTRAFRTLAAAGAMALLLTSTAQAQGCLPLEEFEKAAYGQYKELPESYGKSSNGWTVTVWMSEGGKTWTLAAISPDGKIACVLGDGTDWVSAHAQKGKGA